MYQGGGKYSKYDVTPTVPTVPIGSIQGFRRSAPAGGSRNPYNNFDQLENEAFNGEDKKRNIRKRTTSPHDDDLYRRLNEVAKGSVNTNSPLDNPVFNDKRIIKGLSDDDDDDVFHSSFNGTNTQKNRTSPRMSPRGRLSPRGTHSIGSNSPRVGPAVAPQVYNSAVIRPDPQSSLSTSLSVKQQNRFNEHMNASPPAHHPAQLKMLEYIQYWMCLPETQVLVDRAIKEVKQQAERESAVRQAWTSKESSPAKDLQTSITSLPSINTPERRKSDPLTQNSAAIGTQFKGPNGKNLDTTSSKQGPHATPQNETPEKVGENKDVYSKESEERKERRRKKLEKAEKKEKRREKREKREKLEKAEKKEQKIENAPESVSPPLNKEEETKVVKTSTPEASPPRKEVDSAEGSQKEKNEASPPPPNTASREQPELHPQPPQSQQGAKPQPHSQPPSKPSNTTEEIPQFYFPLGKPTLQEDLISGPTFTSATEENPHLKAFEGVSFAAASVFDGGEGIKTGPPDAVSGEKQTRSVPMSTLKVASDENTHSHIQREFSRLPPAPKLNQKVRLLSGRLRNSNVMPLAKQEANYRHQLVLCLQRLATQCFGVPRYFSLIIFRLLQSDLRATAGKSGNNTSSSLLAGSGAQNVITAQHVKDFYDKHLKGKNSFRRTFDLLILSCSLANQELTNVPVTNLMFLPETTQFRTYLLPEDFVTYIECLLQHHPGLSFLHETPDFQIKYLDTVIYRLFYTLDRQDRGRISFAEFQNSSLLDAFRQVDATEDINTVLQFFSYEHFYVLYCRFWELDEDRDMILSKSDFVHYAPEDVVNPLVVERVFKGVGRRKHCKLEDKIDYEDFVWFCLSEEDKSTTTSIKYWFRILDIDGDGILSLYELHLFYEATKNIIAQFVVEGIIEFEDVICQVCDMLRVSPKDGIRLSDLLRDPEAASVSLNMLTNVVRFLQYEQRDPFVLHSERLIGGLEQTAWDRFARGEYDRMALEADD